MTFDPQSVLMWNKFDYNFIEKTHTYYYQNQYPVKYSVTQYISKYFPEFDSEKVSATYAKKHGLTKEEVLADWKRKGEISSISGTLIHSWLENAKRGKTFDIDLTPAKQASVEKEVEDRVNILLPKAKAFHKDTIGKLYPIRLEYTVGIKDIIAGNIDMLCWNDYAKEIQIWDYKNTKEISREGFRGQKCLPPFTNYADCNYVHYSIQLNMYKAIIQKILGISVGNMYLVHFDYTKNDDSFDVIQCADYQVIIANEIEKLISENS